MFYGTINFENDKNALLKIKSLVASGNIKIVIEQIEKTPSFVNLPIDLTYSYWKNKFNSRFVERDEIIEEQKQSVLDALLFNNPSDCVLQNKLSDPSKVYLKQPFYRKLTK